MHDFYGLRGFLHLSDMFGNMREEFIEGWGRVFSSERKSRKITTAVMAFRYISGVLNIPNFPSERIFHLSVTNESSSLGGKSGGHKTGQTLK